MWILATGLKWRRAAGFRRDMRIIREDTAQGLEDDVEVITRVVGAGSVCDLQSVAGVDDGIEWIHAVYERA